MSRLAVFVMFLASTTLLTKPVATSLKVNSSSPVSVADGWDPPPDPYTSGTVNVADGWDPPPDPYVPTSSLIVA
jgi:hypothetical protein